MIQVEEHRICVPIRPHERVGKLCEEIVRRFNEMFGQHGFIAHVALQNPHGGVFADSDYVGHVFTNESELFLAYPYDEDWEIKSVVHLSSTADTSKGLHSPEKQPRGTAAQQTGDHAGARFGSREMKRLGRKFNRCSKLPLPLVVALLANESERDLIDNILRCGSYGGAGGGHANEWPELAINAAFLEPTKEMLQVEVRWHEQCVEVTNVDAFLLCLQQLGLCTPQGNSKYIGKVLRDRLKMDRKNPLVRDACASSLEFGSSSPCESVDKEDISISYAGLKEIIQEDYGVYLRANN
ncbi:hypothetical protein PINS_up013478 [Pythium insidiosum]|nr:hypothetical protein PINS_up013478 [Pythium insidiosum]